LRAVVVLTTRVDDLKSVRARGKTPRSPSKRTARTTGSNGLDILEIIARTGLKLYGDRVLGASPRKSERLAFRDGVVGIGELDSPGEDSESTDKESS
jgi:hypothetical protein